MPKANILGQIGDGGRIALNILNLGRLKLGIGAVGSAKLAMKSAVQYSMERKQFKRLIGEFGLIERITARLPDGPATLLVTSTEIVQLAPAATVPPLRVITSVPEAAVTVPPSRKAGLRCGILSSLALPGCSSRVTSLSPVRLRTTRALAEGVADGD